MANVVRSENNNLIGAWHCFCHVVVFHVCRPFGYLSNRLFEFLDYVSFAL